MQGTPAGLPFGMPGIGLVIDGAIQQAAQEGRQEIGMGAIEPQPLVAGKRRSPAAGCCRR
ncbi:hypothetical protein JHS3_23490 [Jeongeupia sp. HS-3]|nr:hypothetical protein JHS3_23490 [Jeongeupia sp. HS-3]